MRLQQLQPSSDFSNIWYQDFTRAQTHTPLSVQDFGSGGRAGLAATLGVCSTSIKSSLKEQPPQKHHHNPPVLPTLCYELPSFNQPLLKAEESGLHCWSGSGHPRARSGGLFPWPHHATSTRERVTRTLVGLAMTASVPRPEGDSEQALRAKQFRRTKCALFVLDACSRMLRAQKMFCCQLLLCITRLTAFGEALELQLLKRQALQGTPLQPCSPRTRFLCPCAHSRVGGGAGIRMMHAGGSEKSQGK